MREKHFSITGEEAVELLKAAVLERARETFGAESADEVSLAMLAEDNITSFGPIFFYKKREWQN